MSLPAIFDVIDGERRAPGDVLGAPIASPNDGKPLYLHIGTTAEALDEALAAAARVHQEGAWAALSANDRAGALERVASALEGRAEELAGWDAATTGVVLSLCRTLAGVVPHTFRAAARLLRSGVDPAPLAGRFGAVEVTRRPRGPAAVIAPWNAPVAIAAHKTASALAAGCPVLLKPSDWAPHGAGALAEAALQAGLPAGLLQLVHGGAETGRRLVADERVASVSFTGGLEGGRAVAAACAHAMKPLQLELGGNNPLIVLDDAPLDGAADGVVAALTTLNGQWCRGLGRLLVARAIYEPLLERVLERLARLKLGDSRDIQSEMGPLVHERHRARVSAQLGQLVRAGGTAHAPTPRPALAGSFLPPTLVTGAAPADTRDEIFGPVAAVHPFDDDAEALALANGTAFGLAAYVFGAPERALPLGRRIRAGVVKINGVGMFGLHPDAPRPAWGLSGIGDEGTRETFELFRGTHTIGIAGGIAGGVAGSIATGLGRVGS